MVVRVFTIFQRSGVCGVQSLFFFSFLLVPNQTNHGSQLRWAGCIEQTVNLTSATTFLVWAGRGQYENQVEKHHSVLASNNIINGGRAGPFIRIKRVLWALSG